MFKEVRVQRSNTRHLLTLKVVQIGNRQNKMSMFELICRVHNFAVNVMLGYLNLIDIVKILTILRRNRLKFVPSATFLIEILQKSILNSIYFSNNSHDREIDPTLSMIGEDKTLTLQMLPMLHYYIKRSTQMEHEPCKTITFSKRICTIWNHEEEKGLSFKLNFPSLQCSDQDCNQIVLWYCDVCESLCSECLRHSKTCEYCDEEACKDCFLTPNMCKKCSYICSGCKNLFIDNMIQEAFVRDRCVVRFVL
jgi:hypothetical protein